MTFKEKYSVFSSFFHRNSLFKRYFFLFLALVVILFFFSVLLEKIIYENSKSENEDLLDINKSSKYSVVKEYFLERYQSPYKKHKYTIKNNDSIEKILNSLNVKYDEIKLIVNDLKKNGSLTAIRVAQIAKEAGIPDGVLNVIPGYGDVGEALGRHNDVDAVSFTGSTEVGALFMKYSGESNLKTIGLEMGGKSPFIVLEDAKITDDLIDNAINSAFWNGGQNCSANMRQIIHSKVKDEFLDKISKKVKSLKVGDPLDPSSNMGSMISKKHLATVDGFIQKGIDEGAKLLLGGVSENSEKGFFAKPTLFDNLKENMVIAQEEIFGPVLGVLTVSDTEEALKIASNSKYGLHASVFTQDIDKAFYMAKSLPCGTVSVNTFSEGDIKTPFGGYKQSGSLSRDQGTEALNSFLQTKTIWISHQ